MKINKNKIIQSLLGMLIMTVCFILIDLFTPIKNLILNKQLLSFESLSYINLDYGDWIIITMVGILLGFKDKKTECK